jgi:hypothetical protein
MKSLLAAALFLSLAPCCSAQQGWWMREPIRWVQTNLRYTDASLDPQRHIAEIAGFDANVLLMNLGGIYAFYPTKVRDHLPSSQLPPGRDTFGEVLRAAHARGIRVVGRFDFSKTHKAVFDAHPDWFFKKVNGEPAIYNGLYQVCINGDYYRLKAPEILTEALQRYDVDGLFFNMFGNQSTDYSGNPLGICQCDNCKRLFRARFGRELPASPDEDHRTFMRESSRRVAESIVKLVRSLRPNAAVAGTVAEIGDIVYSESNTAVGRPLPLWPYTSSDNVNRARNSYPEKMAVNACMSFIDYPWRFATVPPNEIRIRLWQNVAHGGAAAFNMHATLQQEDRTALEAARPIFAFLRRHEENYTGQESAARVLLFAQGAPANAYRGFFRLLSEEHIPFAVVENLDWLGKREADLVIAPGRVPLQLEEYVRQGGRLLAATAAAPPFDMAKVVKRWSSVQGYFRIRDHALFPSLKSTNLAFMYGDYLEVEGPSPVTFIPPSMFGPPELVHVDWRDTDAPGLVLRDHGKGRIAWLPWDIGSLYYLHSSQAHAGLVRDLIDHLLPRGRQLRTSAHPLVEITWMRRQDCYQMHFINLSGHSQTGYLDAIPMSGIQVEVMGAFRSARLPASGREIPLARSGGYTQFTLPELRQYELVELR